MALALQQQFLKMIEAKAKENNVALKLDNSPPRSKSLYVPNH